MTEVDLIRITYNPNQQAIDFSIPAKHDSIVVHYDNEIARTLRHLADCLDAREYPFGNLSEDHKVGKK